MCLVNDKTQKFAFKPESLKYSRFTLVNNVKVFC